MYMYVSNRSVDIINMVTQKHVLKVVGQYASEFRHVKIQAHVILYRDAILSSRCNSCSVCVMGESKICVHMFKLFVLVVELFSVTLHTVVCGLLDLCVEDFVLLP